MPPKIIDLRNDMKQDQTSTLLTEVLSGLQPSPKSRGKRLPMMLLYNERGLRLFDAWTMHSPKYHVFSAEVEILKEKANEIVDTMNQGICDSLLSSEIVVLELGAGALRKTSHVLGALARLVQAKANCVTYYALDLNHCELERTLSQMNSMPMPDIEQCWHGKVKLRGICATYDQGIAFIQSGGLLTQKSRAGVTSDMSPRMHFMFFGNSLGNFESRASGADFLRSLPLRPGSGDTLLIGLDHDNGEEIINQSYNEHDTGGYMTKFIMNAWKGAGEALGDETLFDEANWEYLNTGFVRAKHAHTVVLPLTGDKISFLEDERVEVAHSFKFSDSDVYALFAESHLHPIQQWSDSMCCYSLWLLQRPEGASTCKA
ncbi:hypothetical protein C8R43DRAFT_872626 [Mycena crocata]|nr:hypothetical protein C8R43DRAFT_872626 [Mycena crocata]